jgi:predicted metalloprotease with PDZ domain
MFRGARLIGLARLTGLVGLIGLLGAADAAADQTIQYRLSFPEPEHHWMQVETVFPEVPSGPLQLRISRSSPGRYALHEFAKNVYDVQITNGAGRALMPSRPNLHQWDVDGHDGTVRVRYRVYGDRVDGTYLGIDASHAHINPPAALMWARGLDRRPVRVTFEQPANKSWTVATQLFPAADPLTFTAPNLQYLLDSPMEFGPGVIESFKAPMADGDASEPPTIRVALHHAGSSADVAPFVDGVRRIVEQARRVFGEYPAFENKTYTFLADYLPWASGDGMEHRNSTVISSRGSLAESRIDLLGTVSHEFFHAWNVERIRPRTLEPFNFDDANVSGELWLAEGVTSYYDDLLMARAGLIELPALLGDLTGVVSYVVLSPATRFRTAEDMSRLAPFVDAASWIDRTNWPNTFISYYIHGAALGMGLDFAIREKTGSRKSLDDVMRVMWTRHGKPGGKEVGYVDNPYGATDVTAAIGEIVGDQAWAADLMKRHVQGHDVMDYRRLAALAGLTLKPRFPGRATLGLQTEPSPAGLRVAGPTRIGTSAYKAGLDQDDVIKSVNGQSVGTTEQLDAVLRAGKPGDTVKIVFVQRGREVTADAVLDEDPRFDIVAAESVGESLTDAQKAFRKSWLAGH